MDSTLHSLANPFMKIGYSLSIIYSILDGQLLCSVYMIQSTLNMSFYRILNYTESEYKILTSTISYTGNTYSMESLYLA